MKKNYSRTEAIEEEPKEVFSFGFLNGQGFGVDKKNIDYSLHHCFGAKGKVNG